MVTKVLLALKPDIHVKGSDYTRETVPEKETVKQYGGRVAIGHDLRRRRPQDPQYVQGHRGHRGQAGKRGLTKPPWSVS